MDSRSPENIAAGLTPAQRALVLSGPSSFHEADALPQGLFEEDCHWDRETGDEWYIWEATELGEAVRAVVAKGG